MFIRSFVDKKKLLPFYGIKIEIPLSPLGINFRLNTSDEIWTFHRSFYYFVDQLSRTEKCFVKYSIFIHYGKNCVSSKVLLVILPDFQLFYP